jgi:hypothetical protein
MGIKSNNVIFKDIKFEKVIPSVPTYDDFTSSIDTNMWDVINPEFGTLSVSNSELTISNTSGSSSSMMGILSKNSFPIGTRFISRVKHVAGQHSCYIGMFESVPTTVGPHGGSVQGAAFYGRATQNDTIGSYRDENNKGGYAQYSNILGDTFYKFELYRESASTLRFYVDDVLVHTTSNVLFQNDYKLFLGGDGYTNPNTMVVDYAQIITP